MADSFSDLLQQILPALQAAGNTSPLAPANLTPEKVGLLLTPMGLAQAALDPVRQVATNVSSTVKEAGGGSVFGPMLAPDLPPAARSSPAGAAGFQAGRAIGALLSGAGPGGLAQVAQQGQAEWHNPEAYPLQKGLLEAPFDPLSYVGMPQGKAAGALADVGGPLGRAAGGLARGNEAWQGAVSNAIQSATDLIGAGVRKLPAAIGETSVRSAKTAEAAAAQDVAQRFGRLADQSIAPPEARNAVRFLAGEETARAGAAAPPPPADLISPGRPSDFDAALGIDRTAGAPTRGALDQLQEEVINQYTSRARHDIDIARTAYEVLGLPKDAPLSTVIAQADAAAPPILDAIPEAQRLYQEAHPGQPIWNDSDFNSLLQEAEHNVAAASPGIIDDNAAHWSTVLHWMQDTYGDLALNQRGAAAAAARRLTLERGTAPLHPAAESLGLTPGTPEPPGGALGAVPEAAAAPAPPEGIPLGKAQIDPTLLQQNLDAGMPMAEARAKAVVNTEGGIPPVPPAGTPTPPPGAGPLDLRAPGATGGVEGVPPSAPPVEAAPPPGGGLSGAPGEALAGAETVAPPGAPAGTAPAAAPGAPATQFDTAGNVVAGEAVPAGMPPEMAAGLTPVELGRVAGLDPELVARMQANAPRIVSQFEKDRIAFRNLQAQLAVVGDPPPTITAAQAALKRAEDQGALTPTVTKEADTLLRGMAPRYPNDTPFLDPAAEAPALLQSWLYERGQQIAKGSRLKDLPSWVTIPAQGWNWAMNAMRMLEVLSGMQPAKHIADAYLHRVGFVGETGIPDMGANLWQALRTGQEAGLGPASAEWYASHGLAPPSALTKSAYAADIGTALETAGTSTAGQSGFYRARTYLKNVTDALARTASDTARNGGFMTAFDETAAKEAPALAEQLTGILGDAGAPVAEQVVAAKGIVTPGQLSEWMQAAGAAPAAAKEALFALGDFQRTASQAGMALADKMAPGAVTLTNLDEALRYAIPFHTFATRQAPRTLELFLTNPKIWELFDAYHRAAQEENQQAGILPGTRLSQRVPVFEIAGQKVYINPLDYFAEDRPFKQPFNSPKQSPLIGEPYQRLSQQGLGLAGPLGLLLNATGALGPAPPPELTPVDSLLSNALSTVAGQQITMPWQGLGNARLSTTPIGAPPGSIGGGVEAFDPELEVRKRLAEKSMEDTGRVNDPRYVAAMTNKADPLYQAAAREVNGRELLQELVRMLGAPIALQNRAEGAIGRGMAGIPQVNAAGGGPTNYLLPRLPYANAQGPLVTNADRQRQLLQRAQTQPAAIGYASAYSTGQQGGAPSEYSALVDSVRQQVLRASPAEQYALWMDPRTRGIVLDMLAKGQFHPGKTFNPNYTAPVAP